jgi:hypothetical protein
VENFELDYGQNTLFGAKTISTIGYNEQEIIRDILFLHAKGKRIDCDPTYSIGNFYKKGIPRPKYKFDKFPQLPDVVEATSDNLPLENESCDVIMFDPPFVITGDTYGEAKEGSSIIAKRFTGFHDFDEIKTMYSGSLKEFNRILRPNGIVIFKCQDVVACGKNHFTHVWTMDEAVRCGFYPKDLFILLAKNRIIDGREQQHGRKYHSYFWVFQKTKCKVEYNLNGFEKAECGGEKI